MRIPKTLSVLQTISMPPHAALFFIFSIVHCSTVVGGVGDVFRKKMFACPGNLVKYTNENNFLTNKI